MAFELSYSDASGVDFLTSYWRVVTMNFDILNKTLIIIFDGYKDNAARVANKSKISSARYVINGSEFDTFLTAVLNKVKNPQELAYETAKTRTRNYDVFSSDGKHQTISRDVSFFQAAADV